MTRSGTKQRVTGPAGHSFINHTNLNLVKIITSKATNTTQQNVINSFKVVHC